MSEQNEAQEASSATISRRVILGGIAALAGAAAFRLRNNWSTVEAKSSVPKDVRIVAFTNSGQRGETVTVKTIVKTDAEWKAQLPRDAYNVTRQDGTERPFTSAMEQVHDKGIFTCVCCDTALFNEDTKFDSGTGWPSFWQPIAKENVRETTDSTLGMDRIAVSCRRCAAHLGHVFDDGPRPTGLRYCMNGVALKFNRAA